MKIQYCSDLHLEFKENRNFLDKNPIHLSGEILLLAGDVNPFALIDKHNHFFDFDSANYESAFWLPYRIKHHYHSNTPEFTFAKPLLTNLLGYVQQQEQKEFLIRLLKYRLKILIPNKTC